jgi:hypothetical protein
VTVVFSILILAAAPAFALEGRILVPYVTGHPETHVFTGHPGWVDAYYPGTGGGISARIDEDGTFTLPDPEKQKPICLIAMLDKIETPPIIVPNYGVDGKTDIVIPTEYACVPDGYPEVWDEKYMTRATNYYQTIVPHCTQLYGISVFDGPEIIWWGNKINSTVHEATPGGEPVRMRFHFEDHLDHQSAGHSFKELPRMGWRHGDLPVTPGKPYAIRVGGYRSHGGKNFELDAYIRPDNGDGYPFGNCIGDGKPLGGDLCALIFGNSNGQLVENHIRSEEWEIFIPKHRPSTNWGQSFTAHGVSLAGISFWAASATGEKDIQCRIVIHPDGTWEPPRKMVKVAVAHKSPVRPIIRYPEWPGELEGYSDYYKLPADLYQVSYAPDEMPLEPGKMYYIEVQSSKPIMMYADGDYYQDGYAYYEGLKVDRLGQPWSFHSPRWTLAMNIVTYAKPGGGPLSVSEE